MTHAVHYGQVCPEEIAEQLDKKYLSPTRLANTPPEMSFLSPSYRIVENAHRAILSFLKM